MEFEKLVKLLNESGFRPAAPKNMGGSRLYRTKESEGPVKGYAASSVGRSDNHELSRTIDRWEYDPNINVGKSGASTESKIWKSMLTSFKLLFNDQYFDKKAKDIINTFNKSRDSYKNVKGFTDKTSAPEGYDEENQLEKLERNQSKYRSDIEGYKKDIKNYNTTINYSNMPPGKVVELRKELARLESQLDLVDKLKKEDKTYEEYQRLLKRINTDKKTLEDLTSKLSFSKDSSTISEKIKDLEKEISSNENLLTSKRSFKRLVDLDSEKELNLKKFNRLSDVYSYVQSNPAEIERIKSLVFDTEKKLLKWEDKLEKTTEELETLYDRINQINQNNEKVNEAAIDGFINTVKYTAMELAREYQDKVGSEIKSLDQLDWDQMPSNLNDAVERLKALESDDVNINPILGYLRRFERDYNSKEFSASRELDKNVNITSIRDFNKLPFVVLSRIYSSVRSSDKNPIPLDKLNTVQTDASNGELTSLLDKMSGNTSTNKSEWENPNTKSYIKGLIDQLTLTPFTKDQMKKRVDRPWLVDRGKTPPALLKLNIQDESKIKKESFDDYFESVINEMKFDEDDYKTDLIEILEKCKGPTKKTSSDREGKKWMKCARQTDGSYKKIHWGQAGVRVTGKSGDTKRKKSFRSRHNCSNAKPGTANALSCSDW